MRSFSFCNSWFFKFIPWKMESWLKSLYRHAGERDNYSRTYLNKADVFLLMQQPRTPSWNICCTRPRRAFKIKGNIIPSFCVCILYSKVAVRRNLAGEARSKSQLEIFENFLHQRNFRDGNEKSKVNENKFHITADYLEINRPIDDQFRLT